MLLLFKSTDRLNYSIEAFTMLVQYHFLFSQHQAHQLLWSRFVNVYDLPSHNIPSDLFMEHLNRVCKDAVRGLGANKTPQALVKIGRVVGILDNVMINFDEDNMVRQQLGRHEVANFRKDMITVVKVLINEELLVHKPMKLQPPTLVRVWSNQSVGVLAACINLLEPRQLSRPLQ